MPLPPDDPHPVFLLLARVLELDVADASVGRIDPDAALYGGLDLVLQPLKGPIPGNDDPFSPLDLDRVGEGSGGRRRFHCQAGRNPI